MILIIPNEIVKANLPREFTSASSLPWLVVIGGGGRLGLLAGKLSADGLGNP